MSENTRPDGEAGDGADGSGEDALLSRWGLSRRSLLKGFERGRRRDRGGRRRAALGRCGKRHHRRRERPGRCRPRRLGVLARRLHRRLHPRLQRGPRRGGALQGSYGCRRLQHPHLPAGMVRRQGRAPRRRDQPFGAPSPGPAGTGCRPRDTAGGLRQLGDLCHLDGPRRRRVRRLLRALPTRGHPARQLRPLRRPRRAALRHPGPDLGLHLAGLQPFRWGQPVLVQRHPPHPPQRPGLEGLLQPSPRRRRGRERLLQHRVRPRSLPGAERL